MHKTQPKINKSQDAVFRTVQKKQIGSFSNANVAVGVERVLHGHQDCRYSSAQVVASMELFVRFVNSANIQIELNVNSTVQKIFIQVYTIVCGSHHLNFAKSCCCITCNAFFYLNLILKSHGLGYPTFAYNGHNISKSTCA